MQKRQSVLQVTIVLDPLPGWGYTPKDHQALLENYLARTIPYYHPKVTILRTEQVGEEDQMEQETRSKTREGDSLLRRAYPHSYSYTKCQCGWSGCRKCHSVCPDCREVLPTTS